MANNAPPAIIMRTWAKLLSVLLAVLPLSSVAAADEIPGLQDSFRRSLETGCVQGFAKKALVDYAKMTAVTPDTLSSVVRAKIEKVLEPLHGWCACMARNVSVKGTSQSDKKMEIAADLSSFSASPECADPTKTDVVRRNFLRLVEASPPTISSLKTKRTQFSLTVTMNNALPSVFAAYTRPPETLTRLVFLAPGTGIACGQRDLCTDPLPLEIENAKEMLTSYARVLGKEGSRVLRMVIDKFGEDSRVISSGGNFGGFLHTTRPGEFEYPVQSIDGVPLEKTTAKRIWLVVFASEVPEDPRALVFSAAVASVVEVEFLD